MSARSKRQQLEQKLKEMKATVALLEAQEAAKASKRQQHARNLADIDAEIALLKAKEAAKASRQQHARNLADIDAKIALLEAKEAAKASKKQQLKQKVIEMKALLEAKEAAKAKASKKQQPAQIAKPGRQFPNTPTEAQALFARMRRQWQQADMRNHQRKIAAYSNPAVWAGVPPHIAQALWQQLLSGNPNPRYMGVSLPFAGIF